MTIPMPHVARMAPYALVKVNEADETALISLSQNESFRPPSPKVITAATTALNDSMLYPDPDWSELRQALADHHGIGAETILCGNGSLDLIACIAQVFAGPGRSVLAPAHAYPFFRSAAQMAGARFDTAAEVDATVCVQSLLDAVTPETGIVFVANPGNPTGTRISRTELLQLRVGLRPDILLVLDEAYGEFADHLGESCFDMVQQDNTVVLRTFSKAYGMAGFRVGWGLFPPQIASEIRKVMNPNNIPAASQAAAVAAVRDQRYMRDTCNVTAEHREKLTNDLRRAGFVVARSHTNFVLIDLGDTLAVQAADWDLRRRGVLLRPQAAAGLPHCLRMTVGSEDANTAALSALLRWKEEHQG